MIAISTSPERSFARDRPRGIADLRVELRQEPGDVHNRGFNQAFDVPSGTMSVHSLRQRLLEIYDFFVLMIYSH